MIRSFSYVAHVGCGLLRDERCRCEGAPGFQRLVRLGAKVANRCLGSVLARLRRSVASNPALCHDPGPAQELLEAYLLEKALYEVLYELDHRPAWLRIPIDGILALCSQIPPSRHCRTDGHRKSKSRAHLDR